jgi:hypothetical protein
MERFRHLPLSFGMGQPYLAGGMAQRFVALIRFGLDREPQGVAEA